jgi:excisionase family DNA binding protein
MTRNYEQQQHSTGSTSGDASVTTANSDVLQADRLYTLEEAAEILRLSPKTLSNWASAGESKGPRRVKLNGRTIRYRRTDLQAYINSMVEAA